MCLLQMVSAERKPADRVDQQDFAIGKPPVVEETFPLHYDIDELCAFIDRSRAEVDGWISFYWGEDAAGDERRDPLADAVVAAWLRCFAATSGRCAHRRVAERRISSGARWRAQ